MMAGYEVRNYLSIPDYDRFYELFHAMSEAIISKYLIVSGYCEIIQFLSAQDPEIFSDPGATAHIEAFTVFAKDGGRAMHRFYWTQTSEDVHQNVVLSMNRWKPYDAPAWDNMLAQMIAILQPFVQSAWGYYETMISYPLGSSPKAENVQKMILDIGRYLDKLSRRCDPEEIERFLFRPSKDEDWLSPYGNI